MSTMFNEAKLDRHFVSSHLQFSIFELPEYSHFLRILTNFGFGLNSPWDKFQTIEKAHSFLASSKATWVILCGTLGSVATLSTKISGRHRPISKAMPMASIAGVSPSKDQHYCFQLCGSCYDLFSSGHPTLERLNLTFIKDSIWSK